MNKAFMFTDELGPEKILEIYDPSTALNAFLVIDNVAAGPSIGGLRMAKDVSKEECFRLARAMTLKNAMAGLAHGGGKSVIAADPNMPQEDKERLIRSFAHAIKDVDDYIVGPDMGTNEAYMACIKDITGRSVGLPRELGGIPLDEIGATGFGLSAALQAAQDYCDLNLQTARFVVQGFGSVGQHVARFLCEQGAHMIAVSDSKGARRCDDGFDVQRLIESKRSGASVVDSEQGEQIDANDLLAVPCDIWIPAARPDVITIDNVSLMNTKVIAQGANIPATVEAEKRLAEAGTLVIPDFVANAGGVICAAVEFHGGSEQQALNVIDEKIRANVHEVLKRSSDSGLTPRNVALTIASERVVSAMSFRKTY